MKIHKIIGILLFLIFIYGCSSNADYAEIPTCDFDEYPSYYNEYIKDPSEAIYEQEKSEYIYENYGSSASMEYLNRGDADSYSGGGDFDRNY